MDPKGLPCSQNLRNSYSNDVPKQRMKFLSNNLQITYALLVMPRVISLLLFTWKELIRSMNQIWDHGRWEVLQSLEETNS